MLFLYCIRSIHSEIATMFLRIAALTCALAIPSVVPAVELRQLTISELAPGARFEITTLDRFYRGQMLDPATGEVRLTASYDGIRWSEPQNVFLLGATQGRYRDAGGQMLVKMNQVQANLRIEMSLGPPAIERHRYLTEAVRTIRVE